MNSDIAWTTRFELTFRSMFRKIGHFEISVDGDVVNVRCSPEFNLEVAQDYAATMESITDRLPPVFGVLMHFDSPPIVGPDVEAFLRESAQHRAQLGMASVAFVIPAIHRAGLYIACAQWDRIYRSIRVALEIFSSFESARVWLQQQIQSARENHGNSGDLRILRSGENS